MTQTSFYNISIEKQEHFWDCAIKFFAKKGYHAGSIGLFTKECGIAKGLPYLYFQNKEDLYINVCQESLKRARAVLYQNHLEEKDLFTVIEQLLVRGKYICKHSPELFMFYFNTASSLNSEKYKEFENEVESASMKILKQKILEAQKAKLIDESLDIKMTAYIVHSLFLNFCSSLITHRQKWRVCSYLEFENLENNNTTHNYLVSTLKMIWKILGVPNYPINIKEIE